MSTQAEQSLRTGYVALVGRPNVGKSTLLNRLLGMKISIVSRKPQTTRHRILGITTSEQAQIVWVDTPGLHRKQHRALNRSMNRTAVAALRDVDLVLFVVEALQWTDDDALVLEKVQQCGLPCILVVNKEDLVTPREKLLPYLQSMAQRHAFEEIIPLSARQGGQVQALEKLVAERLPETEMFLFPEEQVTDRSERFLVAELIREQVMRALGQEVPYSTAIEIEQFKQEGKLTRIHAAILVERPGQKAIMIGKGGNQLKRIGTAARKEIEQLLDGKVFLELWVKVREGWADDERAMQSLGYEES
ncbi:GTPase Era [Methylonatrum kenyense]|uniref:GTPase Era n=1 Tax=Methylonatrum kenyense TaxID=455253 RepID=UPI0020C0A80D|nr:GTPase Era [Methylonatrum kenyense]MCK8514741.1 GTPase Era [Methylonatrum kenyense]